MGEFVTLKIEVMPNPGYAAETAPLPKPDDVLQELVSKGATAEQLQKALYITVQNGDVQAAKKLVEHGANPAVKYGPGKISLLDVVGLDNKPLSKEMISFLQEHGAASPPTRNNTKPT